MRVRWAPQKGRYPQGQSFPRQLNEKYLLMDHKRHQKMTQRCRLSVAAKLVGEGTNTSSNKFGLDYLIRSEHRTRDDWTEISNAGSNKRTFDKEDANSEKLDQWMRDSVVEVSSYNSFDFVIRLTSHQMLSATLFFFWLMGKQTPWPLFPQLKQPLHFVD